MPPRDPESQRCYLPSDHGSPPSRDTRLKAIARDKAVRRVDTDHVIRLEAEIAAREADGTLIEDQGKMDRDTTGLRGNASTGVANARHRARLPSSASSKEDANVNENDDVAGAVEAPKVEAFGSESPQALNVLKGKFGAKKVKAAKAVKKTKTKAKRLAKATKGKVAKKANEKAVKVLKKPRAIKKSKSKGHLPRSQRTVVPTCINYHRVLLKKIDAAAKKEKKARGRLLLELAAKRVGYKLEAYKPRGIHKPRGKSER